VISGMAKSLDIAVFVNTISQYGIENLQFIAPFIVLAEVLIGLMLIFQIWQKKTAMFGFILIAFFTLIFTYGLLFKEITDCGCFGKIKMLNTSPVFTFIRNFVLMILLFVIWKKGETNNKPNKWIFVTVLSFMCLIAFFAGYTFPYSNEKPQKYIAKPIKNSVLNEFVKTSKDSIYLVFAFTYTCPHCLNSIANLKEYENKGVVDRIIGLTLNDSVAQKKFIENFNPNFEIKTFSAEKFFSITKSFPKSFYIRNDSIIAEFSGELPCFVVFNNAFTPKN